MGDQMQGMGWGTKRGGGTRGEGGGGDVGGTKKEGGDGGLVHLDD